MRGSSGLLVWSLSADIAELVVNQPTNFSLLSPDMRFTFNMIETGGELWQYPDGFSNGDASQLAFSPSQNRYASAEYSPDSRYLIFEAGDSESRLPEDPDLWIWDIEEGRELAALQAYRIELHQFSPDMTLLAYIDQNHSIHIYDLETASTIAVLDVYVQQTLSASFTANGELIYRSCAIRLPYSQGLACSPISLTIGNQSFLLPDNQVVEGASEREPLPEGLLARSELPFVRQLIFRRQWNLVGIFSSDGRLFLRRENPPEVFAIDEDGSPNRMFTLPIAEDLQVNRIIFSPDGSIIAANLDDGTSRLWDTEDGQQLAVLRNDQEPRGDLAEVDIDALAFSPDGQWLATSACIWKNPDAAVSCFESDVQVWNVEEALNKGELLATTDARILTGAQDYLYGLVFSPNGELLVGTGRGFGYDDAGSEEIHIWNLVSGELSQILDARTTTQVAFSADGRLLIGNSRDGVIYRWGVPSS